MHRRHLLLAAPTLLLAGCAALPGRDPVRVQLAGLDPLESEGLELRFLCRLRVQNPNDTAIDYRGVAVDLRVRGSPFASGVSDAAGTIPAFGEAVVQIPITISAINMARVVIGFAMGEGPRKVDYVMNGKLGGGPFGTQRFTSSGELTLPGTGGTSSGTADPARS